MTWDLKIHSIDVKFKPKINWLHKSLSSLSCRVFMINLKENSKHYLHISNVATRLKDDQSYLETWQDKIYKNIYTNMMNAKIN